MDYSSDRPISTKDEDKLNRWPFAKRIADTLATRTDAGSLVVGLYGPWGDGKTSALRLMRNALADSENVVATEFNPWLFGSDEQLLRGFFATLAASISATLLTGKERIGKLMEDYGSLLSVTVPGLPGLPGLGAAAQNAGKALSTVDLAKLRERLEQLLQESGKHIVVLIDDIDRLNRKEIQSIFKLVKLSASFDYVSYILAFDDEIVAAALGEGYGAGDALAGRSFLEKIIQVPLRLPPTDKLALREITLAGIYEALKANDILLADKNRTDFLARFFQGLEPALNTPRKAKQYTNCVTFALPLLKGEAHLVDLLLIEGIRVIYPNLYIEIRDNPSLFLKGSRGNSRADDLRLRIESCIDKALDADKVMDCEDLKRYFLPQLFPKINELCGNTRYGPEWNDDWARAQRICSELYFDRFFSYGVTSNDVSDISISRMVEAATVRDAVDEFLTEFARGGVMHRVIEKLRQREPEIPVNATVPLVLSIARNGALLPRERGPLIGGWTFAQTANLLATLIKKLDSGPEREDLAKKVIETGEPLPFALTCFEWIQLSKDGREADRVVSKQHEEELGKIIARRVKHRADETPIYKEFPLDTPRLLSVWHKYGKQAEASRYLCGRFEQQSIEIDDFLMAYGELSQWRTDAVFSPFSHAARRSFDAIAELIDPSFIVSRLRELHGTRIDDPQLDGGTKLAVAELVARKFVQIHSALEQAKADPPEDDVDRAPSEQPDLPDA